MGMDFLDYEMELYHDYLTRMLKLSPAETKHYTALVEALQAARQAASDLEYLLSKETPRADGFYVEGRMPCPYICEDIGYLSSAGIEAALLGIAKITQKYEIILTAD